MSSGVVRPTPSYDAGGGGPLGARTRTLVIGAAVGVAGFLALALLVRLDWHPLTDLDVRIADDLNRGVAHHAVEIRFWLDVSAVFSPTVLRIASLFAAAVLWWRTRRANLALVVVVAVVGTTLLSSLSKYLVNRDRPRVPEPVAHAAGQSYPSGHALTSFVAFALIVVLGSPRVRRWAVAPVVTVIAAVAFSRLILGVHYLSDVVGAWLLGLAWLCVVLLLAGRSPFAARVGT